MCPSPRRTPASSRRPEGLIALVFALSLGPVALAEDGEGRAPRYRVTMTTGRVMDVLDVKVDGGLTRLHLPSGNNIALPSSAIRRTTDLRATPQEPAKDAAPVVLSARGRDRLPSGARAPNPDRERLTLDRASLSGGRETVRTSNTSSRLGSGTVRPTSPTTAGSRIDPAKTPQQRYSEAKRQAVEEKLTPAPGKMSEILSRINGSRRGSLRR